MKKLCLGALLFGAGLAAACTSSVPAGTVTESTEGAFTTGWACACPNGATSCALPCPDGTTGTCQNGQPYCHIQVGEAGLACACPNGGSSCTLTCPDGSSGQCSGGVVTCGGSNDAGGCCPAGWNTYSCTYPDGHAGAACHNPQLGCASSTTCGQGCDTVVSASCIGPSPDAGTLQWYTTCGYPVCPVTDAGPSDAGPDPGCPAAGTPCSQAGQMCGVASAANCGVTLVCATQDPKGGVGGCPISSRQYKDGIQYVDPAQLQQLHDEALGIRLATYQYKPQVDDPAQKHLGFIIEDNPASPAVDGTHHRVDLYGYVSMAIAGMQVQEKEIAELRKELENARREAAACKAPHR